MLGEFLRLMAIGMIEAHRQQFTFGASVMAD